MIIVAIVLGVFQLVGIINLFILSFTESKRGIHDMLAGTTVFKRKPRKVKKKKEEDEDEE